MRNSGMYEGIPKSRSVGSTHGASTVSIMLILVISTKQLILVKVKRRFLKSSSRKYPNNPYKRSSPVSKARPLCHHWFQTKSKALRIHLAKYRQVWLTPSIWLSSLLQTVEAGSVAIPAANPRLILQGARFKRILITTREKILPLQA